MQHLGLQLTAIGTPEFQRDEIQCSLRKLADMDLNRSRHGDDVIEGTSSNRKEERTGANLADYLAMSAPRLL